MNKLITVLLTLLTATIIGLGIYNFIQTHEYREYYERGDLKGEARTNPLYATRLFLKQMGIPSETKTSLQGLSNFPDSDTILLLDTKRTTLSKKKIDQLIQWVESGGHLITKANKDEETSDKKKKNNKHKVSRDPLQKRLGIHVSSGGFLNELDDTLDEFEEITDKARDELDKAQGDTDNKKIDYPTISLNGVAKKLTLRDNWFRPITVDEAHQDNTEEIKLDGNNYMIRQRLGDGMVTLMSDMKFIENKKLGTADHAEILWYLVHGLHPSLNQPKAVWLIHNDEMPPLWALLWKYAWELIISLTLLSIAWLLKNTQRFGPLIPKAEEDRRSLTEHITSSGHFYWKNNKRKQLLESSRQALMQRLAQVYPGWSQRSKQEQIDMIAEQSKHEPETLYKALFTKDITTAEDFTRSIELLEHLRKTI